MNAANRRMAPVEAPLGTDILWLKDYLPYRMAIVAASMLRESGHVYKRDRQPLTTPQWRTIVAFDPLNRASIAGPSATTP